MEFKPRPYTKREFLSKLQKPYVNPDTKEEVLPKQAPPSLPLKPGQPEINRALEVSLKDDDKNKTIQEIDREKLEKKFSNEDKGKLN